MKQFLDKKILVTGAAGFIGSHIAETLINYGAQVIGIDNMFNGLIENLNPIIDNPNFKFLTADVRDVSTMIELTKDIDIIFHEAAFISVQQSISMPEFCNDVNVNGTLNILNAARINDVDKVLFASSAAIYGDGEGLPKRENMYPEPLTPYGVSKLAGESYMVTFYKTYGLNTTSLRYFNVYGPRQRNTSYAGVISLFTEKILKYHQNPKIFGDGTQTRDFIYVKDVVKANLLAAISEKTKGKVMNVATGRHVNVKYLTELIIQNCNVNNINIEYAPYRKGDILHSQADISILKETTGFEADYQIEKGIKEYIENFKKSALKI